MPTLQKEINDKTKIALTILFAVIVVISFLYLFCCDEILIESTMVTQDNGQYVKEEVLRRVDVIYLVQWAAVISLVAIVWMWRLKFGITGFAGIQGAVPDIEPRSNDEDVCEENSEAAPDDDLPSPSPADQSEVGSSPEAAPDDDQPSPPPENRSEVEPSSETAPNDDQPSPPPANRSEVEPSPETVPASDQPSPPPVNRSEVESSPEAAPDDDQPSSLLANQSEIVLDNGCLSLPSQSSINQNETARSNRTMIRGRLYRLSRPPTKQKIVSLLEEYHALTKAKVAKILGLSVETVQNIVRDNPELFRASGKGLAKVITYAQSTENEVIDNFINGHVHEVIISDTRPAQVDQFDADAIILTEKDVYLFEIKRRHHEIILKAIRELRLMASQFHNVKIHIVLIYLERPQNERFFYKDEAMTKKILKSQKLDLQVFLASELEKERAD